MNLNSDYTDNYSVLIEKMLPGQFPMLRNAAADANGIGVNKQTYHFWHESVFDYILICKHIQLQNMQT